MTVFDSVKYFHILHQTNEAILSHPFHRSSLTHLTRRIQLRFVIHKHLPRLFPPIWKTLSFQTCTLSINIASETRIIMTIVFISHCMKLTLLFYLRSLWIINSNLFKLHNVLKTESHGFFPLTTLPKLLFNLPVCLEYLHCWPSQINRCICLIKSTINTCTK